MKRRVFNAAVLGASSSLASWRAWAQEEAPPFEALDFDWADTERQRAVPVRLYWPNAVSAQVPLAALVLVAALQALPAYACSYLASWRPPSPQRAFETAQVVVHARVVSETSDSVSTVTIKPLKILKGTFSGNAVENPSSSMCGANLVTGVEYVFFFPRGAGYSVSTSSQPAEAAAEVLSLLPQNARGLLVPEPTRPSGRYFQTGLRRPARPTTNDPDPIINMQIDLGSQELCNSRLAAVPKDNEMRSASEGEDRWCSPESASATLKYHGMLKNSSNGKALHIETDSLEWCQAITDQAKTASAASGKANKLSLECQAR
jgi:hypothetical protein